jgi:hypothetical protein
VWPRLPYGRIEIGLPTAKLASSPCTGKGQILLEYKVRIMTGFHESLAAVFTFFIPTPLHAHWFPKSQCQWSFREELKVRSSLGKRIVETRNLEAGFVLVEIMGCICPLFAQHP